MAGLSELANESPDLRRSKRWFSGAAEPKTASDLDGWRGISSDNGRVTQLEFQVAGAAVANGLCRFSALQVLNLSGSTTLARMPENIGNLKQLKVLDLSACKGLGEGVPIGLPRSLGDLSSLQALKLNGCENLARLPLEICNLSELTTLELQGCKSLSTLPMKLAQLQKLKKVDIRGCSALNDDDPAKRLIGRLTAAGCTVVT